MDLNKFSSFSVNPKKTPYGSSFTDFDDVVLISIRLKSSFDLTSSKELTFKRTPSTLLEYFL